MRSVIPVVFIGSFWRISLKKLLVIPLSIVVILFVCASAFAAQSPAHELDSVLAAEKVSCSQAAWFILTAADVLHNDEDAFTAAQSNRWLSGKAQADSPIRLGEVSLLIMRAFGLKGGFLYTVFPNTRYAFRELVYLRLIQGKTDPAVYLDGGTFMQILGSVLSYTGDDPEETPVTIPQNFEVPVFFTGPEVNPLLEDIADITKPAAPLAIYAALPTNEQDTVILQTILFQAYEAKLLPSDQDKLDRSGETLRQVSTLRILITGHSAIDDSTGTTDDFILSLERAHMVAEYLVVRYGIASDRITIWGHGSNKPVDTNDTREGRQNNRRVEIRIYEK
jgi:outer membrane protein OmpA-like peptidoglycan-associated protein